MWLVLLALAPALADPSPAPSAASSASPAVTASGSPTANVNVLETMPQDPAGIDWMHWISQISFMLLICMFLIPFTLRFLVKRTSMPLFGRPPQSRIKVLERQMIGTKQGLILVQVDERVLLIGTTEQQMATLAQLDSRPAEIVVPVAPAAPAASPNTPFQFQNVLQSLLGQRDVGAGESEVRHGA